MNIVDELVRFYYNYDRFQDSRLEEHEIAEYFEVALRKGRILTTVDGNGRLLGYVESWRISHHQFGKILCLIPFNIATEDIEHGPICYVANTTIDPDYRRSWVVDDLKAKFFQQNYVCSHFVGEARRKKHSPLKVFDRLHFFDKYMKKGSEVHG